MGNVLSAGLGQAPARQAALKGGLPPKVGALTINKVCGSGLKAVMLAAQGIATGDTDIVVAGGMESMSNAPYLLPKAREGMRLGHGELIDSMVHDGLWEAYEDYHMGCCGEIVSETYGVTREQQDAFALESHRKAIAAIKAGQVQGRDPACRSLQAIGSRKRRRSDAGCFFFFVCVCVWLSVLLCTASTPAVWQSSAAARWLAEPLEAEA